jgi:hypothetical protein
MMLPLEPTDDLANPAFKDAASCAKWLSQLQLTNLNLAQGNLRKQLDELNRFPLRGHDRLQVLEALRETVSVVQTDFAKKLSGKKLPLTTDELTLLLGLSSLWQSMLTGYLRCLQSLEAGDKTLAKDAALLCQRSLLYASLQVEDFVRAGYEPAGKNWQQLHAIYAHIESLGVQAEAVRDERFQSGRPVCCRTLYAKTLLMHRARLLGLTRSQWQVAERWLCQWGEAISIDPRFSMSKGDAPPLAIDLAGTHALQSVKHARAADTMRFLPMVPLSKLIRVKTILLQQGNTPQKVELGGDLQTKDCVELLNRLHSCWCEEREESLADAPRAAPSLYVCIGLEQVYSQIARKPFKAPKEAKSNQDVQRQIETFGRVLNGTGGGSQEAGELGFVPEEWLVDEDSLLRGRLLRLQTAGERLSPNHVVTVFPPDTVHHKIGIVDQVHVTQRGQLYMSLHYLPGQPQAVVVQGKADNEMLKSGSAAAVLLPPLEKLRIPASIVLPRDWFQAGRAVEVIMPDQSRQKVTLGFSVEKGADYERVSFKPAA